MPTSYSLSDALPKDSGGAKFAGWINVSTSQLDMSLPAGIGAKTTGSKIVSHLAIGTHVSGSIIEPPAVGVALMIHYASNASPVAVQNALNLRGDDRGQLFTTGLSLVSCAITATSHDTHVLASGLLYKIVAAACGAVSGAQVRILNGGASLGHISFSQNSETVQIDFGTGACFSSLITERVNTTQPVYLTAMYRAYGQG